MMSLFDEEQIMKSFIRSERHDTDVETAKRLLKMGKLSFEEIASGTGLTIEEVEDPNSTTGQILTFLQQKTDCKGITLGCHTDDI